MILSTIELRWFFEGEPDSAVLRWFNRGQEVDWTTLPGRTDDYLAMPGVLDLGVKLREGRVEIKGCWEELGAQELSKGVVGVPERWVKWSYGREETEGLASALETASLPQVSVQKQRLQRQFALPIGQAPREVPLYSPVDRVAFAELARVVVDEATHWSLGLEASPDDSLMPEQLTALAERLLGDVPVSLDESAARGYPAWLSRWLLGGGAVGSRGG